MWSQLSPGLRINIFFTLLLGIAYPLAVTGVCQLAFPHQANGSLVSNGGTIAGSELIGQNFSKPEYFHPRPSAAGNDGYDATSSTGSNLGPTNQKLIDRVKAAEQQFRKENPDYQGPIPADLLTASASGLDPHISPASGVAQLDRVAKARHIAVSQLRALLDAHTEGRNMGLLGEPRVNVLLLNLDLDRNFPVKH